MARCDQNATLAVPVTTIAADKYGGDIDDAEDLVEQYAPMEILIGLPLHLNGKESASSEYVRQWANKLAQRVPNVRIRLVDERLTTVSAKRDLHESGRSQRTSRQIIDQQAAVCILETALETERLTGKPPGRALRDL